jgi:hypothetical protein
LDDDSDIIDNGYFELPDDIEITAISDEESSLIDNITFDSSEVTAFPWKTYEGATENELLTSEIEDITVDFDEDSNEHISDNSINENDEYPWGEPIFKTTENQANSQVQEENLAREAINIITNPEEIKEYPWGEPMENSDQNLNQSDSETIIEEVNAEIGQNHTDTFNDIEEFPWGEKNENFDPVINNSTTNLDNEVFDLNEENIGVILPEENDTEHLSEMPPSFNDITEFPWGETVPHAPIDPYPSSENDLFDNLIDHNRTLTDDNE